jgi:hypothetical protein
MRLIVFLFQDLHIYMTSGLTSNVLPDHQAYCNIKKVPISYSFVYSNSSV